jgi:hypothetical protein
VAFCTTIIADSARQDCQAALRCLSSGVRSRDLSVCDDARASAFASPLSLKVDAWRSSRRTTVTGRSPSVDWTSNMMSGVGRGHAQCTTALQGEINIVE